MQAACMHACSQNLDHSPFDTLPSCAAAAALGTVLLSAYGRELQLVSKASLSWEGSSGPALTGMLLLLKAAQGIVAVGVGGSILPISAPWQLGSVLVKLLVVLLHTVPLLLVLLSGAVLSPSLPGRLLAMSSQIHSSTSAGNCNSCSNTRLYTISKHGDSFEGAPAALSAKRLLQLSAGSTGSSNHSSKAAAKRESSSGSSSVATAAAGSIAATDLARISRLPLGRLAEFALGALHAQQPGQRLSIDSCVKQQAQGQDSEGGMALGDAALLGLHVQQMLRLALQCGELVDQALLAAEQVSGAGTASDVAATAAREQSAAATADGARAQGAAEQGAAQLKAAASCVDAHMQTDGDASAAAGVGPAAVAAVADGGGDSGMWHAIVDTLRQHSSEIAHDMKNPLNGVLALSQNVVQVRLERRVGIPFSWWCFGMLSQGHCDVRITCTAARHILPGSYIRALLLASPAGCVWRAAHQRCRPAACGACLWLPPAQHD